MTQIPTPLSLLLLYVCIFYLFILFNHGVFYFILVTIRPRARSATRHGQPRSTCGSTTSVVTSRWRRPFAASVSKLTTTTKSCSCTCARHTPTCCMAKALALTSSAAYADGTTMRDPSCDCTWPYTSTLTGLYLACSGSRRRMMRERREVMRLTHGKVFCNQQLSFCLRKIQGVFI